MSRIACLDLKKGDKKEAIRHANWALKHDMLNPIAPAVKMLADPAKAAAIAESVLAEDPLNYLVKYLANSESFFADIQTEGAQVALDMVVDFASMGQTVLCVKVLEDLIAQRPEEKKTMVLMALAYYKAKLGADVSGILADLMDYGYVTGAYLGVVVQNTDEASAAMFGLPVGAYVQEVTPGYCAEEAGLQAGDIIIRLGEYEVTNISTLTRALRKFKAGDITTVTVFRGGAEMKLPITLDGKPMTTEPAPGTPGNGQMPENGSYEEWYNFFFGDKD